MVTKRSYMSLTEEVFLYATDHDLEYATEQVVKAIRSKIPLVGEPTVESTALAVDEFDLERQWIDDFGTPVNPEVLTLNRVKVSFMVASTHEEIEHIDEAIYSTIRELSRRRKIAYFSMLSECSNGE